MALCSNVLTKKYLRNRVLKYTMKAKFLIISALVMSAFGTSAQILTGDSFAKYNIDKYDGTADHKQQFVPAADGLKSRFVLDKNDQLSYSVVIDCPNQTKDKLYESVNEWFAKAFADKNSSIKTNDAEAGTLIANVNLKDIISFPHQLVTPEMIVKVNVKDGKVRLSSTIKQYLVNGSTVWTSKKCYPFYDEQDALKKKISSGAYVVCCVFTELVEKQLKEAVAPKAPVNDSDDDW